MLLYQCFLLREVSKIIMFEILDLQIAREMVISPQNARLGLVALTRKIGLIDRPDNPDGEMINYRVYTCSNIIINVKERCIFLITVCFFMLIG